MTVPEWVQDNDAADSDDSVDAIDPDVWEEQQQDVRPIKAEILQRTDGQGLLYRGMTNGLFGPPETGKSLIALYAATEVALAGGSVLWLDYEDSIEVFHHRLRNVLGIPPGRLRNRIRYVPVHGSIDTTKLQDLAKGADFIVPADSVNESMAAYNLSPVSDTPKWRQRHLNPMQQGSPEGCFCQIDHSITSDPKTRKAPYGGTQKLAPIQGAQLRTKVTRPLIPGSGGEIVLELAKDRNGNVAAASSNGAAAVVHLHPQPNSQRIEIEITPPDQSSEHRMLVHQIRDAIAASEQQGLTKNQARHQVEGNNEAKDAAYVEVVANTDRYEAIPKNNGIAYRRRQE